ncbi:MAG: low molecular weight protein-tyrosine-phosphatase [Pseudomonadales bacterium]
MKVLFVCLGNICRSPTAHGVFEHVVAENGLAEVITVDSAGTGDWHLGEAPDPRSVQAAKKRHYDLSPLRARQVTRQDFFQFDYILAMDHNNLADLERIKPGEYQGELNLFLSYGKKSNMEDVPDPYYGLGDGFERVLNLIEQASDGLLNYIVKKHPL